MLQCGTACCSVLQCVEGYDDVFEDECVAVRCNVLPCVAPCVVPELRSSQQIPLHSDSIRDWF